MKHILLSCLLLLALCATALAAPVEKQTFRVVAPEGWTVTAVPDVTEGVVLVAPDKSVSVTIVTASPARDTSTPRCTGWDESGRQKPDTRMNVQQIACCQSVPTGPRYHCQSKP